MIKIGHKSKSFQEAEDWDIRQHVQMTPQERQEAADDLRQRVYGTDRPDVREVREAE
jgi:hypothetical protein